MWGSLGSCLRPGVRAEAMGLAGRGRGPGWVGGPHGREGQRAEGAFWRASEGVPASAPVLAAAAALCPPRGRNDREETALGSGLRWHQLTR